MKPARILLLAVAIIAGGLAAFLATRGFGPQDSGPSVAEVQQEAKVQVLVADKAIGVGQRLTRDVLSWQDWPEGAIRPDYVTITELPDAPAELTGAVARFEFFAGEPIREAKLARADSGYLSAVLTPGMRGVSIGVAAVSGAGGFIVPNDRVDVVLTRATSSGDQSEAILTNVKVLAIGTRLGELGKTAGEDVDNPRGQQFKDKTIATLELDPLQAETVINAAEIGDLTLILRSVADFASKPSLADGRRSSTIRMIKFGKEVNILSGTTEEDSGPEDSSSPGGNDLSEAPNAPLDGPEGVLDAEDANTVVGSDSGVVQ